MASLQPVNVSDSCVCDVDTHNVAFPMWYFYEDQCWSNCVMLREYTLSRKKSVQPMSVNSTCKTCLQINNIKLCIIKSDNK